MRAWKNTLNLLVLFQLCLGCKAINNIEPIPGIRYVSELRHTELGPLFEFEIENTGYETGICIQKSSIPFLGDNASALFNVYTGLGEPVTSLQPLYYTIGTEEIEPFALKLWMGDSFEVKTTLSG